MGNSPSWAQRSTRPSRPAWTKRWPRRGIAAWPGPRIFPSAPRSWGSAPAGNCKGILRFLPLCSPRTKRSATGRVTNAPPPMPTSPFRLEFRPLPSAPGAARAERIRWESGMTPRGATSDCGESSLRCCRWPGSKIPDRAPATDAFLLYVVSFRPLRVSRNLKADLLLIFNTVVWGATFVLVKDALSDTSVFVYLALRFLVAAALLVAIYGRELRGLSLSGFGAGGLIGCWMFGGYSFQTVGIGMTTPSKAAFITGFSVVLVPVLLALFGRRRIRAWVWA